MHTHKTRFIRICCIANVPFGNKFQYTGLSQILQKIPYVHTQSIPLLKYTLFEFITLGDYYLILPSPKT